MRETEELKEERRRQWLEAGDLQVKRQKALSMLPKKRPLQRTQ